MPKESTYPKKASVDDNDYIRGVSEENESVLVKNVVMKQYLGEGTATPYIEVVNVGDDKGLRFTEQVSVGKPSGSKEFVAGGGDSYGVGLEDTTPDGTPKAGSAWHLDYANMTGQTITSAVDITTILASDSGSTTGMFDGVTAGKTILVGSDYKFRGNKIKTTSIGIMDPNNVVAERFASIGLGWLPSDYMATDANWPYEQRAHHFSTVVGSEQIRFGSDPLQGTPIWEKLTLNINGTDYTKYWTLVRLTAPITTDPIIEQVKLHTDRTEINSDGTVEHFGRARVRRSLLFGLSHTIPNGIGTPKDATILYGSDFSAKYKNNKFEKDQKDGFGVGQGIDEGLDTSIPLTLSLSYNVLGTETGVVEFQIDAFQVDDTFVYDGTAIPDTYMVTDVIATSSNLQRRTVEVSIRVNKLTPVNGVLISIFRDAGNGNDTLNQHIASTNVALTGHFWR